MSTPKVTTIDFETKGIERRPKYPPEPVGVSIRRCYDKRSKYYSWGHFTGNNCAKEEAKKILQEIFSGEEGLLFHNSKFDVDVAVTHLQCSQPAWERIHDTRYLLFLEDPHSNTLALKPSSERLLGLPPDEQAAVKQWLIDNKVIKKNETSWGSFISEAPGDLVGKYAEGDTDRTLGIFNKLYPYVIEEMGMGKAYDTERELMPILLENERGGLSVNLDRLSHDYGVYKLWAENVDRWIRTRLKSPELNIDSDVGLSDRLSELGLVTEWVLTPTGKRSTSKENLTIGMFSDRQLALALGYRNRLSTCLATFMGNWLEMAQQSDGVIYTNWNQIRSEEAGARTGRMSSNPNFMNIPTDFYGKDDGYEHPTAIPHLPELPNMRDYILPDKGSVWLNRDYSQQEPRILGHFEEGALMDMYLKNPKTDVHKSVMDEIVRIYGKVLHRKMGKIINLGIIYGKGVGLLAKELGCSVKEAKELLAVHASLFPGLQDLKKQIKSIAREGNCIKTWGGRCYYPEEPRVIKGRLMSFEYKLLNYLIQGSAADCTKRSIINYHNHPQRRGRFLVSVHDENNVSSPAGYYKQEMQVLKESMAVEGFDVPLLSDAKWGMSWGQLKDFEGEEL